VNTIKTIGKSILLALTAIGLFAISVAGMILYFACFILVVIAGSLVVGWVINLFV